MGTNGNDVLKGTSGNDKLFGQAGNDTLIGVEPKNPNSPQKDQLIGGSGADVFVLGDETQSYYNLQNWSNIARIVDFSASEGDRIQLHGDPGDYSLKISADQKSTHIKYQGDVIVAVNGKLNLKDSEFSYVDGGTAPIPSPTPNPTPTPSPTPSPVPAPVPTPSGSIGKFDIFEANFKDGKDYSNPYGQVDAKANFTGPDNKTYEIPLFWDGGDDWKLRFSPEVTGKWTYTISSNDSALNGKSGSFNVTNSSNKGGIEPDPQHPTHFQYENGSNYYLLGDTQWRLGNSDPAENLNRNTVFDYIDTRAKQGFTYIHAAMSNFEDWTRSNEGGIPWTGDPGEKVNPGFFQELDQRVEYANSKGITLGFMLNWSQSWAENFDTQQERLDFAEYITARYSADNVVFLVSGEFNEELTPDIYSQIGKTIAANDPHDRMIGIHATGSVSRFAKEDWMSFGDYLQTYSSYHDKVEAGLKYDKPVVNSEYGYYLANRQNADWVGKDALTGIRNATWDSVMAGGYVVTGIGSVWGAGLKTDGPFNPNNPIYDDWEEDLLNVKKLFTSVDWQSLDPHDELISGPGTEYLLADLGDTYVAYVRGNGGAYSLNLGNSTQSQKTFDIDLYDPRTGNFKDYGTTSGKATVTLDPPDAQDWVFVLTSR